MTQDIYIVIAYKTVTLAVSATEFNSEIIYEDATEKYFSSYESAIEYKTYLEFKGKSTTISKIEVLPFIDTDLLRIEDALNKLTEEEKVLLGL